MTSTKQCITIKLRLSLKWMIDFKFRTDEWVKNNLIIELLPTCIHWDKEDIKEIGKVFVSKYVASHRILRSDEGCNE